MLVALLMMLVILMQRPKSEGLGAAFGGAMTDNLFGAQTTNVLVKFTAWLAGVFFAITFLLSVLYAHRSMGGGSLTRELKRNAGAPAALPAAAAAAKASPGPVASPAGDAVVGVVPSGSTAPGATTAATAPAAAVQPTNSASPSPSQQPKP